MKTRTKLRDIRSVILERGALPSNQKIMEYEFGVVWSQALSGRTTSIIKEWTPERQKRFVEILGGPINTKRTRRLLGLPQEEENETHP